MVARAVKGMFLPLFVALAVIAAGDAFTAPAQPGGLAARGGFFDEVADIRYALGETDPTRVEAVSFVLKPTARWVQVRFGSGSGAWHRCSPSPGRFVCDIDPGADLEVIDTFELRATGQVEE